METTYIGTKKAAEVLGILQKKVSELCRAGKIPGAEQDRKGCPWRIPLEEVNRMKEKGIY